MSRRKKMLVGAAGVIAIIAVAGTAFALWSGRGEGEGRAQASEAVEAVINPADGAEDLYPGYTAGDVYFTITNDNPYPIQFTAMTAGTVESLTVGCDASMVTVDDASGLSIPAAPGTSTTQSIADVVSMDASAPDECQGAVFEVVLTLTGTQTT